MAAGLVRNDYVGDGVDWCGISRSEAFIKTI